MITFLRSFVVAFTILCGLAQVDAASRFAVCTVTCTWDGASTAMWSTSSGGATGASVPGSADTVTLDAATCVGGVTCTITVNTTVTVQSITGGACTAATTGCVLDFSVNNNNVTLTSNTAFNYSGTGTRTLNLGNGIWTLNASSTASISPWTMTTTTNLTFNANSSTILYTATNTGNRTFAGGGLSYSTFSIAANSGGGSTTISNNNTFANLLIAAPNTLIPTAAGTNTITNAPTWTGSSGSEIAVLSVGTISTISIASGTLSCAWCAIRGITFSGGASFAATNSFDNGLNTGISITAPSGGAGSGGHVIGG